jgi:hypothetical protein
MAEWFSERKEKTIVETEQKEKAALKTRGAKQEKDDIFGFMAGRLKIVGNIESPIEDWAHWNPAKNLEK